MNRPGLKKKKMPDPADEGRYFIVSDGIKLENSSCPPLNPITQKEIPYIPLRRIFAFESRAVYNLIEHPPPISIPSNLIILELPLGMVYEQKQGGAREGEPPGFSRKRRPGPGGRGAEAPLKGSRACGWGSFGKGGTSLEEEVFRLFFLRKG